MNMVLFAAAADVGARRVPQVVAVIVVVGALALASSACGGGDDAATTPGEAAAQPQAVQEDAPAEVEGVQVLPTLEPAAQKLPEEFPDAELESTALTLMARAEVTNPEWEAHVRERFIGPGVDAWIEGRNEAIAEIGLTRAQGLAATPLKAVLLNRGTEGNFPERAQVEVYMVHDQLDGLALFTLQLRFEDEVWKILVGEPGLRAQIVN